MKNDTASTCTADSTAQTSIFPRAFAVWWKDFERWNVSYHQVGSWHWPRDVVRPIEDFAQLENIALSSEDAQTQELPIIAKINFGGDLFLRPLSDYKTYKGRVFLVQPERFIFSKINARQGCIHYADATATPFVVSSEYPVLRLDPQLALGDYVDLALRSGPAREQLQGGAVGMSKPRTSADDFLRVRIPLPSLDVQAAIVARWQSAQGSERAARARIEELEQNVVQTFLDELGIPLRVAPILPKVFAIEWKDLERWSVSYTIRAIAGLKDVYKSFYEVKTLEYVARVSYGIQKSPTNRPISHPRPYLRVANVQAGYLDLREVKFINVPDEEMESLRLQQDDLLFCEGNSADLVGRPAIWNSEIADCVHQNHVLKVRVSPDKALPQFVLEFMQTPPARSYFRARAKFTTNLASINSTDLREAPIPLPPLDVQQRIMERVQEGRAQIEREREAADRLAREAKIEVEALILGTQKIGDA